MALCLSVCLPQLECAVEIYGFDMKASCYLSYTTHTHTRLTALFPGLPRWAGTRKVKPIWILLKQETVSGSGISSWAICKSAPRSRQTTMPAPHHSVFVTGRMPFLPPNQQRRSTEHSYGLTHWLGGRKGTRPVICEYINWVSDKILNDLFSTPTTTTVKRILKSKYALWSSLS